MVFSLPYDFVYLHEAAPTVPYEAAYASCCNLVGRPLAGYLKNVIILPLSMAQALTQVQARALKHNVSLKVVDAYRPQSAVNDLAAWLQDPKDQKMKSLYYPNIDKSQMHALGYVAFRSFHTRGAAVDLLLTDLSGQPLDMGTGFDFMVALSHTNNPAITGEAHKNRMLLLELMHAHGFVNYAQEWWHFNLVEEPHPDIYFDFPVA